MGPSTTGPSSNTQTPSSRTTNQARALVPVLIILIDCGERGLSVLSRHPSSVLPKLQQSTEKTDQVLETNLKIRKDTLKTYRSTFTLEINGFGVHLSNHRWHHP